MSSGVLVLAGTMACISSEENCGSSGVVIVTGHCFFQFRFLLKQAILCDNLRVAWSARHNVDLQMAALQIKRRLYLSLIIGDLRDIPNYRPLLLQLFLTHIHLHLKVYCAFLFDISITPSPVFLVTLFLYAAPASIPQDFSSMTGCDQWLLRSRRRLGYGTRIRYQNCSYVWATQRWQRLPVCGLESSMRTRETRLVPLSISLNSTSRLLLTPRLNTSLTLSTSFFIEYVCVPQASP